MTTGLKYHTKEADQHRKKLKGRSNIPNKANTGLTKHPLLIATQLCCKKKMKTKQQQAGPEIPPKLPPIYITDVKNISPLIQLLEQVAEQQYEIKALADNQVKVQPKTSESYRKIIKALAEKRTEFHTYKLKEERMQNVTFNIPTQ
jgi:hypothetical protein